MRRYSSKEEADLINLLLFSEICTSFPLDGKWNNEDDSSKDH